MMDKKTKIDFVVPWVDGGDSEWIKKRNKYANNLSSINDARYRDWEIFKYWFRSIEVNAPWVHKVFLIVDNQIPEFLNVNHPKLVIVNHDDYIPCEYLPTFSSHTIEINLHNINELSEQFVYFNDDTFINRKVSKSYFFRRGLPKHVYIERKQKHSDTFMSRVSDNNMQIINRNIKKNQIFKHPFKVLNIRYGKYVIKNLLTFVRKKYERFEDDHAPCPILKSTIKEIWDKENDICKSTSMNKFRKDVDINQYVFRYYDLARCKFMPRMVKHGGYYLLEEKMMSFISDDINCSINKTICLNDNENIDYETFCKLKKEIISIFEKKYPNKCTYEK